jgi:hypothetical protein
MKSYTPANKVATSTYYGSPEPTPIKQTLLQSADRQQTSTRPSPTKVSEPLPGFRRESVLQGMDMLRFGACQCH